MASTTDTGYSKQDWHPGEDYWDHYPPGPFDQGWEGHYHGRGAAGDRRLRDAVQTAVAAPRPDPNVHPGKVYADPYVMHAVDYARGRGPVRGGYYGTRRLVDERGPHGEWHRDDIMMSPSRDIPVVRGNALDPKQRTEEILSPYLPTIISYAAEAPRKRGGGGPGGPGKAAAAAETKKTDEKKAPDRKELYDRSTLVSPEQVDWAKKILETGKMPNGQMATRAQKLSAQNMLAGYERDKNRGAVLFPDPGQEVPVSKGEDGKGKPYADYTQKVKPASSPDRHNDTALPEANLAKYKKAADEQKQRLAEEDRKKEEALQKKRKAAADEVIGTEEVDLGTGRPVKVKRTRGMEDVLRAERESAEAETKRANELVASAQSRSNSLMTEAAKYGGRYTSYVRYYNEALAKNMPHAQALEYAHRMMEKSK